jgi:quercetin dioxygenase-like cupin family protein
MPLSQGWFDSDERVRFRAGFALHGGIGARSSSVVVIDLDPGAVLGEHTDSPEEVLLVLQGDVGITVGNVSTRAKHGQIVVVPPMTPHAIRNLGRVRARMLGFFPSATVVTEFAEPVQPLGHQVLFMGKPAADVEFLRASPIAAVHPEERNVPA